MFKLPERPEEDSDLLDRLNDLDALDAEKENEALMMQMKHANEVSELLGRIRI